MDHVELSRRRLFGLLAVAPVAVCLPPPVAARPVRASVVFDPGEKIDFWRRISAVLREINKRPITKEFATVSRECGARAEQQAIAFRAAQWD